MAGRVKAQTDGVDAIRQVRAAGGLLWRRGPEGLEILLVHRPRLDDWSLPKGKLRKREHPLEAARREVLEETGVRASVGARLPTVSYQVRVDDALVDKVVDYWSMTVVADLGFHPGSEVDALGWFSIDEALARLTYPRDVTVVTRFAELGPLSPPLLVLRHASAGQRWANKDNERPLDSRGLACARDLARLLACFTPSRLVSASPRRCVQTLRPLAQQLSLPVEVDRSFDESADPDAAAKRLRDLVSTTPGSVVVCSQGKLVPPALSVLTNRPPESLHTRKGTGWAVSFSDSEVVAMDPVP